MGTEKIVSVVIPAYNAAETLAETLASVRAQTWRALEIVVVDDGSTDATADIARAEADRDPRIRVLSVPNGGVAAARNAGIAASRGDFVAPIDADDLWHPEKLARQMAVMERGPDIGYVYTFYRLVGPDSRVLPSGGAGCAMEGAAYLRGLLHNFVGNGSALLLRREALAEVGGYDPDLRRRGLQGCEDYLLQLLIARTWRVGCVPEYLTGYRIAPGAMSSDRTRMTRSKLAMFEIVARRYPETPRDILAAAEASVLAYFFAVRMRARRPGEGVHALASAVRRAPAPALAVALDQVWRTLLGKLPGRGGNEEATSPGAFRDLDPRRDAPPPLPQPLARQLRAAEAREEGFFATRVPSRQAPATAGVRKASSEPGSAYPNGVAEAAIRS